MASELVFRTAFPPRFELLSCLLSVSSNRDFHEAAGFSPPGPRTSSGRRGGSVTAPRTTVGSIGFRFVFFNEMKGCMKCVHCIVRRKNECYCPRTVAWSCTTFFLKGMKGVPISNNC